VDGGRKVSWSSTKLVHDRKHAATLQ